MARQSVVNALVPFVSPSLWLHSPYEGELTLPLQTQKVLKWSHGKLEIVSIGTVLKNTITIIDSSSIVKQGDLLNLSFEL